MFVTSLVGIQPLDRPARVLARRQQRTLQLLPVERHSLQAGLSLLFRIESNKSALASLNGLKRPFGAKPLTGLEEFAPLLSSRSRGAHRMARRKQRGRQPGSASSASTEPVEREVRMVQHESRQHHPSPLACRSACRRSSRELEKTAIWGNPPHAQKAAARSRAKQGCAPRKRTRGRRTTWP
eukprot:scaffold1517_cov181-Pinguiococcus_pyrenoidosus.AAC.2